MATLRNQILTSFLTFAAAVSLLFAAASFVTAYGIEDQFFEAAVREEASRQQAQWPIAGRPVPPIRDYVTIHTNVGTLPADLRGRLSAGSGPQEYIGDHGRHYHVLPFTLPGGQAAYAVAEVGQRLVVRPLRRELLMMVGLGAVAVLVAAAALGSWLALRATAPLSRLVAAVSQGEDGEVPQIRSAEFPANEVGTLAMTLEQMLGRIQAFVERESRFTRDASHELRTPLAIIRSSVELIEARGEVPATVAKPLKRIAEAAREMERSVDLLLMLAREERARSPVEDVLLLPLIERIVVAESHRFGAEGFEVEVSVPSECRIGVNEAIAAVILSNLIGNVFRHNEATTLKIGIEACDVLIEDKGRGFAEGSVVTIDSTSAPSEGGSHGLGLSIVSRLCRVHAIPLRIRSSPCGTAARVGLL